MPADAFQKHADGSWSCLKACTVNVGNKKIVLTEGMKFDKGILFMGVDVTEWLDKNYASQQRM